jgi:hypothetical protein
LWHRHPLGDHPICFIKLRVWWTTTAQRKLGANKAEEIGAEVSRVGSNERLERRFISERLAEGGHRVGEQLVRLARETALGSLPISLLVAVHGRYACHAISLPVVRLMLRVKLQRRNVAAHHWT